MPRPISTAPGRQAERTELSWERSASGLLTSAAVLAIREHGLIAEGRVALTVAAVSLALLAVVLGRNRSRGLNGNLAVSRSRAEKVPDARRHGIVFGVAVALFGVATAGLMSW
jgi:hypothetical protein